MSSAAHPLKAPLVATDSPAFRRMFDLIRSDRDAIAETVAQPWPRCAGERIDPAEAWAPYFSDEQVVSWLEAEVFTAAAAIRLDRAGYLPRDVAREYEPDVTYGLAFARGDISFEQLSREGDR